MCPDRYQFQENRFAGLSLARRPNALGGQRPIHCRVPRPLRSRHCELFKVSPPVYGVRGLNTRVGDA